MSKMLYIFKINDPNNMGAFPPPILDILDELIKESEARSINGNDSANTILLFDSEEELSKFLDKFRITDTKLLADIDLWKTAHNITYSTEIFSVSEQSTFVPIIT